jgi:hypothetical protein
METANVAEDLGRIVEAFSEAIYPSVVEIHPSEEDGQYILRVDFDLEGNPLQYASSPFYDGVTSLFSLGEIAGVLQFFGKKSFSIGM